MKLSVREARAQFSRAIAAARSGERVVITNNGQPVAEIIPPRPAQPVEDFWEKLERVRAELGLKTIDYDPWPAEFDDPAFSRKVLMLDENPDIEPK